MVEFHVQSSIEPQRYCVWLSKANYTYRVALQSSHLVIHFLTADDRPLAGLFGTQTGDTVDNSPAFRSIPGPVVSGAPAVPRCLAVRRIALLDEGGDHVCLTTEPVAVHTAGPFRPLRLLRSATQAVTVPGNGPAALGTSGIGLIAGQEPGASRCCRRGRREASGRGVLVPACAHVAADMRGFGSESLDGCDRTERVILARRQSRGRPAGPRSPSGSRHLT